MTLTCIIAGAHTTPRFSSFCDDSIISLIETRGSELDLLAPEVIHLFSFHQPFHLLYAISVVFFSLLLIILQICMECIWTERRQADSGTNGPATTAFLTQGWDLPS